MPKEELSLTDEQARAVEALFERKRKEAGFGRQTDAAVNIGVSQDLISRTERSFTLNMRIGDIGRIMQAYKISPNELYEIIGLFEPIQLESNEKYYIERELLPVLSRLRPDALTMLKRVAGSLISDIN